MALAALFLFALTAGWLARWARRPSRVEAGLVAALVFAALVVGSGHLLSCGGRFGDPLAWLVVAAAASAGLPGAVAAGGRMWSRRHADAKQAALPGFEPLPGFRFSPRAALPVPGGVYPLALAVALTGVVQLAVAFCVAPGNPDGLSAHGARVAFYLQNNGLSPYANNYWAQVTHGQNSSILMAFFFLAAGRREGAMALVQFGAYWLAGASVYGVARTAGQGRAAAAVSALLFLSLTSCLLEATTLQNDLLVAAFLGAAACFLLAFGRDRRRSSLAWAALAVCLGLGTKITFALALPSLATLAGVAALGLRGRGLARAGATLALAGLAAGAVVTLPGAYLENLRDYGNPVGPPEVRRFHSFEGRTRAEVMRAGALNAAAFGVDFLTLDGLPPVAPVRAAQRALRQSAARVLGVLGIDPARGLFVGSPFSFAREPAAHEDLSNWGLLGFTLLWPAVLLAIAGVGRPGLTTRALALGSVLFFLAQAFAGPYDPHRGRYFIAAGVLTAPVAGHYLERGGRLLRGYFFGLALLQAVAVLGMLVWRDRAPVFIVPGWSPGPPGGTTATARSIFQWTRAEQLTRDQPELLEPLRRFEAMVPPTASVHVRLGNRDYDYVYFGRGLTRRLTAGAFRDDDPAAAAAPAPPPGWLLFKQPPPEDYLASAEDTELGQGLFLRRLKPITSLLTVEMPAADGVRADGCQSLAPWSIERFDGRPLFWLGHGRETGLAFGLWSERSCVVTLAFDVAAGPGRAESATRTLLVRERQEGGKIVGTLSFSHGAKSPEAEPQLQVALRNGLNEFTLECADEAVEKTPLNDGGRTLLVILHAVSVRAAEGEETGANKTGPGVQP